MAGVTESVVEQAALAWLESIGWRIRKVQRSRPATGGRAAETMPQVILAQRLRDALARSIPRVTPKL